MKRTVGLVMLLVGLITFSGCTIKNSIKDEVNQDLKSVKEEVSKEVKGVKDEVKKELESALDSNDVTNLKIVSDGEAGAGEFELIQSEITTKENKLEFKTSGIDESKTVFVNVANQTIFKEKITNGEIYTLDIENVADAHRTDYQPKVQLFQTTDDTEDGDFVTFKQARYTVKK